MQNLEINVVQERIDTTFKIQRNVGADTKSTPEQKNLTSMKEQSDVKRRIHIIPDYTWKVNPRIGQNSR